VTQCSLEEMYQRCKRNCCLTRRVLSGSLLSWTFETADYNGTSLLDHIPYQNSVTSVFTSVNASNLITHLLLYFPVFLFSLLQFFVFCSYFTSSFPFFLLLFSPSYVWKLSHSRGDILRQHKCMKRPRHIELWNYVLLSCRNLPECQLLKVNATAWYYYIITIQSSCSTKEWNSCRSILPWPMQVN
jgi:hypothetical protein